MQRPRGLLSPFIARSMNQVNSEILDSTIQLLEIKPADRLLDVGFGGGGAMERMIRQARGGLVAGIDTSGAMLRYTRKKFKPEIVQGEIEVREGSASDIPYDGDYFDKICTINCIYFWPDPGAGLKEILRVLKPGGMLVIAVYLKEEFQRYPPASFGFNVYSDAQMLEMLDAVGFGEARIEHRASKPYTSVFAIGKKRARPTGDNRS
jgi:ubiquinone/menaquinone biosynthesis C-methylase UbiE